MDEIKLTPKQEFQHTATRRWLVMHLQLFCRYCRFQHTATRRWLVKLRHFALLHAPVSTHSHPKVAGFGVIGVVQIVIRFNTQPPEGGWKDAESGQYEYIVSTHSHPKVAGRLNISIPPLPPLFQHTATRRWLGRQLRRLVARAVVSTHSHPKVAGYGSSRGMVEQILVSTHSHPKVAGICTGHILTSRRAFQHTATRRWLVPLPKPLPYKADISLFR